MKGTLKIPGIDSDGNVVELELSATLNAHVLCSKDGIVSIRPLPKQDWTFSIT